MDRSAFTNRTTERGQTILMVALSMTALLAMAAISIDVVTLYVARSEAQHAAEAAALAGAKAFVTSGYTSYPPGFGSTTGLCSGTGTGLAELQAQAAAIQNNIAGGAPTILWGGSSCNFTQPENPRITIQVSRTGLPLFFAKIWNPAAPTVTATVTAEAYNPSSYLTLAPAPIEVSAVKPWLLPNCPPQQTTTGSPNPNCTTSYFFVNQTNGSIANNGAFIGTTITLNLPQDAGSLPTGSNAQLYFYPLAIPIRPPTPACPASSLTSCSIVGNGPMFDNIACSNPFQFVPGQLVGGGQTVQIDSRLSSGFGSTSWGQMQSRVDQGTQCLIHATNSSGPITTCSSGQYEQDCFTLQGLGQPILISPGYNNPDVPLRTAPYISRSDSVVTVPLFDGSNLCPLGKNNPCTGTASIQGFLQLGITRNAGGGTIEGIILNASGWNPNSTGTAVSGGGVSAVPVRLVQ